jgi:hypothetical protein
VKDLQVERLFWIIQLAPCNQRALGEVNKEGSRVRVRKGNVIVEIQVGVMDMVMSQGMQKASKDWIFLSSLQKVCSPSVFLRLAL